MDKLDDIIAWLEEGGTNYCLSPSVMIEKLKECKAALQKEKESLTEKNKNISDAIEALLDELECNLLIDGGNEHYQKAKAAIEQNEK